MIEEEDAEHVLASLQETIDKASRMIEISRKEKDRLSADLPTTELAHTSDDARRMIPT